MAQISRIAFVMRDLRSREIRILLITALCAVICTTSILFTISSIKAALNNVSAALLGGDRAISSSSVINNQIIYLAEKNNLQHTKTINFYSMLSTDTDLVLASIKSVEQNYPLRGDLKITSRPGQQPQVANTIPEPGTIWLEQRVLVSLNAELGDLINVGAVKLTIAAIVNQEPDRVADGMSFAPRALINMQDLAATAAIQPGSRVIYKLLLSGAKDALRQFDLQLSAIDVTDYKIRDAASRDASSMRFLQQGEQYLGLAILVNIILATLAISIVVYRYSVARIANIAILRCMGATSKQVVSIYVLFLSIVASLLGLLGSLMGFGVQQALSIFLAKYLQIEIPLPGVAPLIFGVLCSLLLIVGIAIPQILRLGNVAPIQVLRQSKVALPATAYISYVFLTMIFLLLIYWQVQDLQLLYSICFGCLMTVSVAYVLLNALLKLLQRVSGRLPALLRLSIHNIFYNARNNIIQIIAFALVICVGSLLFITRNELLDTWQKQLPNDTPNYFVINIEQDELAKFQKFMASHHIKAEQFFPIVRGTLSKINQDFVTQDDDEPDKRKGINRALNLTWTQQMPENNSIVAGKWFTQQDIGVPVISIEQQIADRLHVKIGDQMTFVINGEDIVATVISIRNVQWDNFKPNFYVIYPDGLLRNAAYSYMTSFYVAPEQEKFMLDLVSEFSAINLISISVMLDYANSIVKLLSFIVAYIWAFSLLVVILLLSAIVLSSLPQRNYQTNLMRILGSSKRQIMLMLFAEFCLLGTISGLLGASVAVGMAKYVTALIFKSSYPVNWYVIFWGAVAGSIIMLITGLIGTNRALKATPIQLSLNLN